MKTVKISYRIKHFQKKKKQRLFVWAVLKKEMLFGVEIRAKCHNIVKSIDMGSNPQTHPAYSYKQNILTTTPFNPTIIVSLNNIWPTANDEV